MAVSPLHGGRAMTGRVVIDPVALTTAHGYPLKALVGHEVPVTATVFRDGHGERGARLRWRPIGVPRWQTAPMVAGDDDRWTAAATFDEPGLHEIVVDGWTRRYATWQRDLERWLAVGEDVTAELLVGAGILEELLASVPADQRGRVEDAIATLRSERCATRVRLDAGFDDALVAIVDQVPDPGDLTESVPIVVRVERERAGVGAWYELFPRSEGGLAGATKRLDAIAEMGFDVVYLPPIHPIGVTGRKGRGNAPVAQADDVGSPWAIGSSEGGHCAIDPSLGTFEDFDRFVARAGELGMEVALDYALQCSPDHPWVTEHPEWFRRRADGSIRYAENPPKRYQDIYPLEFWPPAHDRVALWEACREVLEFWIARGVRVFRVDNPHTKAVAFWEWLIPAIWEKAPDVVFLAEAFTRPAMMHRLAEVGFSQSYTYFTWRDEPWEVYEYLQEISHGPDATYFRPNFWPTTPDILAGVLRHGNRAAFELRAVLAALLSPSWGIYSGYEHLENEPASPDNEEFADSEKYRIVPRDWTEPGLAPFLGRLNEIRRGHRGFSRLHDLTFHYTDNDRFLAWSKGDVLVVANFDTDAAQETTVFADLGALGLPDDAPFRVVDLLDDDRAYTWRGSANYVRLDPSERVAHVFAVERS
jgi:starch synthase (maltosyl-transferring)